MPLVNPTQLFVFVWPRGLQLCGRTLTHMPNPHQVFVFGIGVPWGGGMGMAISVVTPHVLIVVCVVVRHNVGYQVRWGDAPS